MISIPAPAPLFNPLTSSDPLTPAEIWAGPLGLLAFLPLVPVVLLLARWRPRLALCVGGLAWLLVTLQWFATAALLGCVAISVAWVVLLGQLRRREVLSARTTTALVWIGLHALILPVWWIASPSWYPSRMAVLHNVGLAYFLLRLIAWGVDWAKRPGAPLRPLDTLSWLLYPPCMRLGPVLRRDEFLERLDAWVPWRSADWLAGLRRMGWFLLGAVVFGVVSRQIPPSLGVGQDFFAMPELYPTYRLLRAFYLVPIQIYLLLWMYNELAAALACWIGIRVDDNFNWLPRATSVRDFWRRWNITIGAWLRDYIYIPLGGNRRHAAVNILVVFAYCGLWHGASWSFLAWGVTQAAAIAVERGWDRLRERVSWTRTARGPVWTALCWLLTMHYQIATIVIFADFEHLGLPLFRELAQRLISSAGAG